MEGSRNMKRLNTRYICAVALGIALYVVMSMAAKIPVIGHIGLDMGYVVLAVYCYCVGSVAGAIVGGCGCVLVSLISSGWFPPGWLAGNIFIGFVCGYLYSHYKSQKTVVINALITAVAVCIGVIGIKTAIECVLYGIPIAVKIPKNAIAGAMDAGVMILGVLIAPQIDRINNAR